MVKMRVARSPKPSDTVLQVNKGKQKNGTINKPTTSGYAKIWNSHLEPFHANTVEMACMALPK